ncbi:hypothetical protein JXA80_02195 [bacterium]|nr:hypothetical protein [candidate division CSSED10-310 bacterium]
MSNIRIGVARIDFKEQSVTLCNSLSRKMMDSIPASDWFTYLGGFVSSADGDEATPFLGSRKNIVHENYLLSMHTIRDTDQSAWIFLHDVTDRVRLESIAEAVNIMDNIGFIFSGIRHEIGNPINTIKMTMSVLKKNLDNLTRDKISSYVDRTLEEVLRLEELLQSLKSYNMFDKPKPRNVNMQAFINKFISLVEQDFCTEGVSIKVSTTDDLWAFVDPRGLQQVLLNVSNNAFDALRVTENPVITLTLYRFVNQVCIKLTDNGCGIPDSQMNELFQPFYTTKAKGTGLGLVISKKILRTMNCTIKIHSQPHRGTSVIIGMPLGAPNE